MQGKDKPLLAFQGRPMVQQVCASAPAAHRTFISANRNLEAYTAYGEVFTDEQVGCGEGPLVGVLGALQRTDTEWLLVAPGDTPCLPVEWYLPLVAQRGRAGAVVHDGERQHHLHAFLPTRLAGDLQRYLQAGEFKVWQWLDACAVRPVNIPHPQWFKNMNAAEDLAAGRED